MDLGIPTIRRVMGHLVGHVLTEPETVGVDADFGQEKVDSDEKVAQSLVIDDPLITRGKNMRFSRQNSWKNKDIGIDRRTWETASPMVISTQSVLPDSWTFLGSSRSFC
jgi:hypothetical protein